MPDATYTKHHRPKHKGSAKLFKNEFLEKLTKTHIAIPLSIFTIVSCVLIYYGIIEKGFTGPADPTGLGVPRSFARADRLPVEPGKNLDLVVELLPVSAMIRSGHRVRIAIAGNDASCFSYYGSPGETFTLTLGGSTHLALPVLRRQQ